MPLRLPLKPVTLALAFALALASAASAQTGVRLSAPAGDRYCVRNKGGLSILPNGRVITPYGRQIITPPHPFGLTLSPNGAALAAVSSGQGPVAVTILTDLARDTPYVRQIPPAIDTDDEILPAAFMGVAFSGSSRTLYVSGGDQGNIIVFDVVSGRRIGAINLNGELAGRKWEDSFIGDLKITRDGRHLYAVDQANFRLVIVGLEVKKEGNAKTFGAPIAAVPVGRYPFAVTLSPDEGTAYVANVGMFEYSMVKGIDPAKADTWLPFPPYGFNTKEMREGIKIGEKEVPGLGDPNAPESFSVWKVDLSESGKERVAGMVKTGVLIGQKVEGIPAVGGSCPNSLATDGRWIYVSNGSNDSVSVIDAKTFEVAATLDLGLREIFGPLRGQIPFGLCLSPDGRRLYVAEAGINSVAVIDTEARKLVGRIPTAWFPSKVEISRDGSRLFVSCAKGHGAGPNGGKGAVPEPGEVFDIGNMMKGVVLIFDVPRDDELPALTQKVVDNLVKSEPVDVASLPEPRGPVPPFVGAYPSPIKHVVYVTKENRTFDQVFGDYDKVNGDPSIAAFGMNVNVTGRGAPIVRGVNVMPNHQALARRYAISDNFYCDSDHSSDGHRWLVGTYPNAWTETATKTSPRSARMTSTAPGRLLMTGSSGAIYPEDYNQAGSIWEHLHRNGLEFRNYGLGFEMASSEENDYGDTGIRIGVNYPMPEPLFNRTSRSFPTFNTAVPDQLRMNHFEAEFKEKWLSGKEPFPPLVTIMLPNDHGSKEVPERGYPYLHSYMADNDLALGRLIEDLSRSPWWKETAIFVTEDDAQGGQDHVDHHRSILMILGPWVKPGYVSKRHVSFGSILKTIFLILGLPPLNQYDAAATDLSDCFVAAPDPKPYAALPVDPRIFDAQKALDTYDEKLAWKQGGEKMDDEAFTRRQREQLKPDKD